MPPFRKISISRIEAKIQIFSLCLDHYYWRFLLNTEREKEKEKKRGKMFC
jgi:hypothetical protein